MLLVDGEVVGPPDDGGRPGTVHDRDVIRIILVELFDIAKLPGAQHFRKRVINLLLIRQRNGHIRNVHRRSVVLLFLLFLLRCGWRRTYQEEREGKEKQKRCLQNAGGGTNCKIFLHSRATPLAEENSTAIRTRQQWRPVGLLCPRGAEHIDEQAVRSGNTFRQLPEEGKPRVNVRPFSVMRVDEPAIQLRLARIAHGQQRRVFRIELRPEIEPALLHPALEIILRNLVGTVQQRISRLQKFDRRILVGDARQRPGGAGGEISAGYGAYLNLSHANSRWYCTTRVPPFET